MSELEYEIVDVFTDRPFAGNPLAVVYGAAALATDQLQALAREFHLSETVFILDSTVADYRARIFTPAAELPFAGHPSVGAAVCLRRRGLVAAGTVTQECGVGVVGLEVHGDTASLAGAATSVGPALPPEPSLAACGLTSADFAGPAPRVASAGLPFTFLPVRADAVARSTPGGTDLCVFAWNPADRSSHARVFAGGVGVGEDPATGSAALAFGAYLVAAGLLPADGESLYVIHQGIELHRPSVLAGSVHAVAGVATRVTVTGSVVPVATGRIAVPPFVG